jgi:hypothetical protein
MVEDHLMGTRIPKALHRRIRIHCIRQGLTMKDFVNEAINEKLHGPKKRMPKADQPQQLVGTA